MLANSAEAGRDTLVITPGLERIAPELLALVADNVFWRGACVDDGAFEEFERPATRGTQFEDCHALMGAVMRPALRCDLRYADVFDAELFVQQGARFVEPIVLRRESHPRIDAIGGPGARVYDGVVGQCDRMEYRRLNAVLPALGKMDLRWLRIGGHRGLRK